MLAYNKCCFIMKVNWENEKENLSQMINDKISYVEIGRYYNITGNAVKKAAKKLGLVLEQRRDKNTTETFNKGKWKIHICQNCGEKFTHRPSTRNKFCDNKCKAEYDYKKKYRILIARGVGCLRCIVFLLYDYDDYVVMKKRTLSIPGS